MIYISTGLIGNQSAVKTSNYFINNGIKNIELSGGTFESNIINKVKKLKKNAKFIFHNYFPPSKKPFTLNLATLNNDIFKICNEYIKNTIRFSNEIGAKFYSFHAGFLVDPKPEELGKKLIKRKINDRNISMNIFLERLNNLSIFAKKEGVSLLIENNVINKTNLKTYQKNPLLMTDSKEALLIMKNTPSNVNLLIDVAHLKVSSKTLKFNPIKFLKDCDPWIKGYHLSDNDGKNDTNEKIKKKFLVLAVFKKKS